MAHLDQTVYFVALCTEDGHYVWMYASTVDEIPREEYKKKIWESVKNPETYRKYWSECLLDQKIARFTCESIYGPAYVVQLHPAKVGEARIVVLAREIPAALSDLSDREREVLRHLGAGHSVQKIARLLDISQSTVETHRQNLKKKTGLSLYGLISLAIHSDF